MTDLEKRRKALREKLERHVANPDIRHEFSVLISQFTAEAIREDRKKRKPTSEMAHLVDVFFNGRAAR